MIILYYDQQMHNYFTNYHTPTCFDTIVSSSGSMQSIPCQVTQVLQMQLLVIRNTSYTSTDTHTQAQYIPSQHDSSINIDCICGQHRLTS